MALAILSAAALCGLVDEEALSVLLVLEAASGTYEKRDASVSAEKG